MAVLALVMLLAGSFAGLLAGRFAAVLPVLAALVPTALLVGPGAGALGALGAAGVVGGVQLHRAVAEQYGTR